MDNDTSADLEASLSIIYYHALMVQEVLPHFKLPSNLISFELETAVKAVRNFDKQILEPKE